MMFKKKPKYEVWFIQLEGEAYQLHKKKRITAGTEIVKSSRDKSHLIDTSLPFRVGNKRIYFVDINHSIQVFIVSLDDIKNNDMPQLDPEMLNFYTEKQSIKQVVSGILGKFEFNWRIFLAGVFAGVGAGWIAYQMIMVGT